MDHFGLTALLTPLTERRHHPKPKLKETWPDGDWHLFRIVLGRACRGLTGGFLLLRNFSVAISESSCSFLVLLYRYLYFSNIIYV